MVGVDTDGTVKVRLKGACGGADVQHDYDPRVERAVKKAVPEVKRVVAV